MIATIPGRVWVARGKEREVAMGRAHGRVLGLVRVGVKRGDRSRREGEAERRKARAARFFRARERKIRSRRKAGAARFFRVRERKIRSNSLRWNLNKKPD